MPPLKAPLAQADQPNSHALGIQMLSGHNPDGWISRFSSRSTMNQFRHAVRMASSLAGQNPQPSQQPAQALIKAVKVAALACAGAGVVLASVPVLVSTPPGLQALMALINKQTPGEVRASKVDFIITSWGRTVTARLHGFELLEGPGGGGGGGGDGHPLVEARLIQCEGSPWQLITGKPHHVDVSGATINGGYSSTAKEFRLISWLEEAGVMKPPPPKGAVDVPPTAAAYKSPTTGGHSPSQQQAATAGVEQQGQGVAAGVAAEAVKVDKPVGAFMHALCDVNDSVGVSGELRQPGLQLVVRDSRLLISSDVRDILGGDVHVTGAFGPEHLHWLHPTPGDPDNTPTSSATADAASTPTSPATLSPPESPLEAPSPSTCWWHDEGEDEVSKARLQAIKADWGAHSCVPGEWQVRSPHLDMHMRVWEASAPPSSWPWSTSRNTAPTSVTLLHAPAAVSLQFSRALSRFGLGTVNPLLGQVTSLSEGTQGSVRATWVPDGMTLPYTSASLWVEPMCLALGASPLITQLVTGLRSAGVDLYAPSWLRKATKPPPRSSHGSRDSSPPGSEEQDTITSSSSQSGSQLLEAWLSGQHVRFERSGIIQQCRVDMLIGPAGLQSDMKSGGGRARRAQRTALHLVLWGRADPDTDQIDMVVGLPEDLLSRMGVHGLPEGYCMPVRLRGDMDAPRLELKGVSARVTQLLLRAAAHHQAAAAPQRGPDTAGATSVAPSDQPEGVGEQAGSVEASGSPVPGVGDGEGEGEGSGRRGLGVKVFKVARWLLSAAVELFVPSEASLAVIAEQIERDAQLVPRQECQLPWAAEA